MSRAVRFGDFLQEALKACYDVVPDAYGNCDFIASYNERHSAYALKREMEYYAFEQNEIICYESLENLSELKMRQIEGFFSEHYRDFGVENRDHMSTAIYYVLGLVSDPAPDLIRRVKKFRFYKSFKFGFKGWVNGSIILLDLVNQTGFSNPYGKKELEKLLGFQQRFTAEANLHFKT